MVTGGRIFRSLQNWQYDSEAILLLVGYQGENTQGRALLEGNRTIKDNEGNVITWNGEIFSSEAFSSHADQSELINWVSNSNARKIFLIHGDGPSKEALKSLLETKVSAEIVIPHLKEQFSC